MYLTERQLITVKIKYLLRKYRCTIDQLEDCIINKMELYYNTFKRAYNKEEFKNSHFYIYYLEYEKDLEFVRRYKNQMVSDEEYEKILRDNLPSEKVRDYVEASNDNQFAKITNHIGKVIISQIEGISTADSITPKTLEILSKSIENELKQYISRLRELKGVKVACSKRDNLRNLSYKACIELKLMNLLPKNKVMEMMNIDGLTYELADIESIRQRYIDMYRQLNLSFDEMPATMSDEDIESLKSEIRTAISEKNEAIGKYKSEIKCGKEEPFFQYTTIKRRKQGW